MSNVTTAAEVKLAQALVAATEALSQPELAEAAGIAKSGVSVAIRKFEEAGLVTKSQRGLRAVFTATAQLHAELAHEAVEAPAVEAQAPTATVDECLDQLAGVGRPSREVEAELDAAAEARADAAEAPAAIAVAVAVAPKAVAWPTLEEVVAGVQAHALAHYNAGGWDVLVETMSADDIAAELAELSNEVTLTMALRHYAVVAAVQADRQADALVEGETEKGAAKAALAKIKAAAKAEVVARRKAVATEQEGYPAVKARALADKCHADYPAGYTSVMGLTHEINARGLYMGAKAEGLTGQSLYTYINANKTGAHPFPLEQGAKNGKARAQINVELGLAWWVAKNERAAARGAKAEA